MTLLAGHDQVKSFAHWIEEAGAGQLESGNRVQRLEVVGVALPKDRERADTARRIEPLVFRIEEKIVDVFGDGDAGNLLARVYPSPRASVFSGTR
jgi:hypothetical protein